MNDNDQEESQPVPETESSSERRSWWKSIFKYLGLFFGGVVALLVVLSVLGIAIPLNFLKSDIEGAVSDATGRNFEINGRLGLVPGLTPSVSISGVRLDGPAGSPDPEFLSVGQLSAGVHVAPLFSSEIHIGDVILSDVSVNLERAEDGTANWQFEKLQLDENEQESAESDHSEGGGAGFKLVALDALDITNINVNFQDMAADNSMSFALDRAHATAPVGQTLALEANGSWQDAPWELTVSGPDFTSLSKMAFPMALKVNAGLVGVQGDIELTVEDGLAMNATVRVSGQDLPATGATLGMALPGIQEYTISADVNYSGARLDISGFEAMFDDNRIEGAVVVDHGASPIAVSGGLYARQVDLNTYMDDPLDSDGTDDAAVAADSTADEESSPEAEGENGLSGVSDLLAAFNADFELGIDDLQVQGLRLHDSLISLELVDGVLDTPLQINLNEVPMTGSLQLADQGDEIAFNASLETRDSDLGQLEQWIGLDGIDGGFSRLVIAAGTRGDTTMALRDNLNVGLEMESAELTYGKEDSVAFNLGHLTVNAGVSEPLLVVANGTLLDETFELRMEGDSLGALTDDNWNLGLQAGIAGAQLSIDGEVVRQNSKPSLELSLSLDGERIGDLSPLIGFGADSVEPYRVSGNIRAAQSIWSLDDLDLGLGDTTINGRVSVSGKTDGRLFEAVIDAPVIDVAGITALFVSEEAPESSTVDPEQEDVQSVNIDGVLQMPILPGGVVIPDADIDITVGALLLDGLDISHIAFDGEFRDGKLLPTPFSMNFGGADFVGEMEFDTTLEMPEAGLQLSTHEIDVGQFLGNIGFAEGLDMHADAMGLQIWMRGQKLGNILSNSEFRTYIENGEWILTDPGSGGTLPLKIESGELTIRPGQPIQLVQQARIRGAPVSLLLETQHPSEITDRVDVTLLFTHMDNQIRLSGESMLPLKFENLILKMEMFGDNFGTMSSIAGLRLPPVGPYALSSSLSMNDEGYYLDQAALTIGDSTLNGHASLLTTGIVPEFDIDLVAEKIQLSDIRLKDKEEGAATVGESEEDGSSVVSDDTSGQGKNEEEPKPVFTAHNLGLANGTVSVRVDDVYSGEEWLGKGLLEVVLRDSELRVEPLSLDVPGGKFDSALVVAPDGEKIRANVVAKVDNFNYSTLARRIEPESDMSGLLFLDIDLESRTTYLREMIQGANGHFDFAVVPHEFESGIVDLWAVGLLSAILPKLGSDPSLVNCLIGRFDLDDGVMTEDLIILDTSKLRASGDATIDFNTETLELKLVPEAKNPQFFRLEAPVEVEGSFSNIDFGLEGGIFGSVMRMAVTTVTTPFKKIFGDKIPEDGSDLCAEPMARAPRDG